MTISLFAKRLRVALSPRLGAILALTAFLSLGAGARDAHALITLASNANFAFSFDAVFTAGTITGSGVLKAERTFTDPVGQWTVYDVTGGSVTVTPTGGTAKAYTLAYAPPNTYPTPIGNDNLLFPWTHPQLDAQGITFAVEAGAKLLGYIYVTDPPNFYNFQAATPDGQNFSSGFGIFQVAPGPAPGTGLAAFVLLILAGAVTRTRGLLRR